METREKILVGAGTLFIKEGFKVITMDSIAQALGISKRTIYENFRDKQDLISNFLLKNSINHKNELLEIVNKSENVIEALIQFGYHNKETFSKYNPLYFEDLKKYYAELFDSIIGGEQVGNNQITYLILKKGVNEGTFSKSIDIDVANRFIHKTMDYFFKLDQDHGIPHPVIWQTIFVPYIKGICTKKGLEILNAVIQKDKNLLNC
ncbi:MAG: TetR/AcrR family transcriptional regulator [Salinivirgaceae bacterium]|nr:TetR/AcrR family transcriptional regulator [Salinivirgaceae bacterium]MDD4746994.1 TetR/AcrR family transcriptional regulator [Salinivirgaceae bacterium]MDY0281283.1 TetR/AcrR family transcriptional regulator [Salinivirgaceae bacterium]